MVTGFLSLSMAMVHASSGGFQLDRSRIVFQDGKTSVSYGVTNHYDSPALASAVVTNFDGTPTSSFAVSPSIYQIPANTTSRGQIVLLEQLPQDRETVFWLNVKTILANKNAEENSIEFALAQRIKLFYRPKGLDEKCSGAAEKLRWEKSSNGVKVVNPSKVSMSIVNLKSGATSYPINDVVMPLSEKSWKVDPKDWNNVSFAYIDELGNYIELPINAK